MTTYKYYYRGEPLMTYCRRHKIHESSILFLVLEHFMSIDEAVEHFWAHRGRKDQNNLKYSIDGVPVRKLLTGKGQYQRFCHLMYKSKDKDYKRIYNEVINEKKAD